MRRLRLGVAGMAVVMGLAGYGGLLAEEVGDDDPLVRSAHQAIAGALNTALEHARSNRPVPWGDPVSNLTGSITVFAPAMQAGKPCRSFKYLVRNSQDEVIDKGLYCRDPIGLWRMAGVPDLLDKHPLPAPAQTAQSNGRATPPADTAGTPAPNTLDAQLAGQKQDSPSRRLQRNLARLAYGDTPGDGSADADFSDALARFEADEGMRPGSDPDAIRHALMLSTATLTRSGAGGVCATPEGEGEMTLVCGRRR